MADVVGRVGARRYDVAAACRAQMAVQVYAVLRNLDLPVLKDIGCIGIMRMSIPSLRLRPRLPRLRRIIEVVSGVRKSLHAIEVGKSAATPSKIYDDVCHESPSIYHILTLICVVTAASHNAGAVRGKKSASV